MKKYLSRVPRGYASAILGSLMLASQAVAQLPSGLPVSHYFYTIRVPCAGPNAATNLNIPFVQEPIARDIVAGVAGPVVTGKVGGYPAIAANTHILCLVTGPNRGKAFTITAATPNTVTLAEALPALVNDSDEYEIVPLASLNSIFGGVATGGPIDLTGSTGAATADKVVLGAVQYFYKTGGAGGAGWKDVNAPNATGDLGSTPIPDLRGVAVINIGAAKDVLVRGLCRYQRAVLRIPTGTTRLSWPYPSEITLLSTGLQSTIQGSSGAATADKVVIGASQYFFKTGGANSPGWKDVNLPNAAQPGANNVVLNDDGKGFFIIRAGGAVEHAVLQPLN